MATRTVGIDLAIRGVHVAVIMDEKGDAIGAPIRFHLTHPELERLVREVRRGVKAGDKVLVVMEPTGMAWFPVAQWLGRAGCTIIRVKGQRVRALRKYLSEHAKTDVKDAEILGALPRFGQRGLTPLFMPNQEQQALNRLTKQRRRYQEDIGSIRRRLKSLVRWAHPGLEEALPPFSTMVSLAVLEKYFNLRRLRALSQPRLVAFLKKHVGGKHPASGTFTTELAERIFEAARGAIKLYPLGQLDYDLLQLEVRQEIARIRLHEENMERLDAEIERLYESLHPSDNLRTIPGLGALLSPSIFSVLHSAERFGGQKRMRGFTGLFPRRSESGGQDNPSQRLTKGGNNRLKRDIVLAAECARKFDPELARVYYTMMVSKEKHHKQAVCAVATRLISRIHMVLKGGRPYVLRDLDGQPVTLAAARAIIEAQFEIPTAIRQARKKGPRQVA